MKMQELLEARLRTGVSVTFKEFTSKTGNKFVGFISDLENKTYVIQASVANFIQFKNWPGKTESVDFQPTGKKIKTTEGNFPLARIRAKVKTGPTPEEDDEVVF